MSSEDSSPERKSGCGLLAALFSRRPRIPQNAPSSSTSTPPVTATSSHTDNPPRNSPTTSNIPGSSSQIPQNPRRDATSQSQDPQTSPRTPRRNAFSPSQNRPVLPRNPRNTSQHISPLNPRRNHPNPNLPHTELNPRRVASPITISGELDTLITEHYCVKPTLNLSLGNLPGSNVASTSRQPPPQQLNKKKKGKNDTEPFSKALSTRMDPEHLKLMGNEDYKKGNFAAALALYDAAIDMNPNEASYRNNKSAALTALGRLLEAVSECKKAIIIEPNYNRAHHKLACLSMRLGDPETALHHFKLAGPEADRVDICQAKEIRNRLRKCSDARKTRDWNFILKETFSAISAGADSALYIYSLQAEAYMRMRRHDEAAEALEQFSNFSDTEGLEYFGPITFAGLLVVRAQVYLISGRNRFEEAVEAAEKATKLDPNSKEAMMLAGQTKEIASARRRGNALFKEERFEEACEYYSQGLAYDRHNSVLLCNRAACLSKIGQLEKAVEDCTGAIEVRPSYTKATLRRADCHFKLNNWESAIEDYGSLLALSPKNEDALRGLAEIKKRTNC